MLQAVTGLESTYLTTVDLDHGMQHVQFADNAGDLEIPEGLSLEWGDHCVACTAPMWTCWRMLTSPCTRSSARAGRAAARLSSPLPD